MQFPVMGRAERKPMFIPYSAEQELFSSYWLRLKTSFRLTRNHILDGRTVDFYHSDSRTAVVISDTPDRPLQALGYNLICISPAKLQTQARLAAATVRCDIAFRLAGLRH